MTDAKTLSGRDIRIALVGCGRISRNHFEAIEKVDGLQLVAVCDVDEARATARRNGGGKQEYGAMPHFCRLGISKMTPQACDMYA